MAENEKFNNSKSLEDGDLDKVSGGGFFSKYSDKKYEEAGVEVKGSGNLWNDGYKLNASGEELSMDWAERAVLFYDCYHRPAKSLNEIKRFYTDVYLPWNGLSGR